MDCLGCFGRDRGGRIEPYQLAGDIAPDQIPLPKFVIDSSRNVPNAVIFSYQELAAATENFSDNCIIGQGVFGTVYRGFMHNINQVVAVKKLKLDDLRGNRGYLVDTLMLRLHSHPNIVNLIGYCDEGKARLLVYEYMPLRSLEHHLHMLSPDEKPLDWRTRMMIAVKVAKGINYLHREANPPMICREIKASNILFTEGYHPKLSGFGMAKYFPVADRNYISTRITCTANGYLAPDYAATGLLTKQTDIYSFGVLLMELITGRRPLDPSRGTEGYYLVAWVRKLEKTQEGLRRIVDQRLKGCSIVSLKMAVNVALACVNKAPGARPTVDQVEEALGEVISLDN